MRILGDIKHHIFQEISWGSSCCPVVGQQAVHEPECALVATKTKELYQVERCQQLRELTRDVVSLPHWRYSGTIWMQFSAMCSRMALLEEGRWTLRGSF